MRIKENSYLKIQKEITHYYLHTIASDLLTASKLYEIKMVLKNQNYHYKQLLANEFLTFCRIKKIYDQIRFLDETGMERVRVNYNYGTPVIVPLSELQNKFKRYYFIDSFRLSKNEVFVSPLDLNIEHGQLELPIKPMIRFGTPIFDSNGKKRGVVLLNYFGSHLLDVLKNISRSSSGKTMLLNSNGYFIIGMNSEDEWGFMYNDKKNKTFKKLYPEEWNKLAGRDTGYFENKDGLYIFKTIYPLTEAQISSSGSGEAFTPSKQMLSGSDYFWKIVTYIPSGSLASIYNTGLFRMLLIYGLMFLLIAAGSAFIAITTVKRKLAENEVRNHRDQLQNLVDQRTSELSKLNLELQRDIAERKYIEAELKESEEKYRSMMETMDDPAYICSNDFRIIYLNTAMKNRVGNDALGNSCSEVIHGLKNQCSWCVHDKVMKGEHIKIEIVSPKDNKTFHVSNSPISHLDGTVSKLTIFRDITEFKNIEAQLQQAQKLESVGRLAGGVAHDYNNALNVILGFSQLILDDLSPDSDIRLNIEEIIKSAQNASEVTKQLLAFARKQTINPKIIDINANIENTLKMIRRLIGEDIELKWLPGNDLWATMIDPYQLNQIITNLCVNARDAISGVGKITIESNNVTIDEIHYGGGEEIIPGDYIRLTISDTGFGMGKDILKKIFEPFFSTKGVEKGTGLGLATVYGIVKQNKGFINVYSEIGYGTTFSIYFLRCRENLTETSKEIPQESMTAKGETILLVEDDMPNLKLAHSILKNLGYTVLAANDPSNALSLAETYSSKIHLVITDVIMPKMDGKKMSEKITFLYPDIKFIYMSGYTADVVAERGMIKDGVILIQKPYSKTEFAMTIRKVLDS